MKGVRVKTCAVLVKYDRDILVLTRVKQDKIFCLLQSCYRVCFLHNVLVLVFFLILCLRPIHIIQGLH